MTTKTANQIIAIQNDYNIGVEVEMNSITRSRAAEVAAACFGTGSFASTASRNGYMTWSAWDQQGREWKFSRDSSIHGPDDQKCELVTPVLEYSDIPLLQGVIEELRSAGAVSNPGVGAGVHIHISHKDGFTVRDITNTVNIMAAHETQIGRAICIDEERTGYYCQTVNPEFLRLLNQRKPQTMEALEDCWYEGNGASFRRREHYNPSRYHMLNCHSFFHGHGTLEFRLFQFHNPTTYSKGGLNTAELKSYIQLCLGICELAHELKYASPRPQQTDNEKYALRCWLLRLGFIGDEFKTAREILLKNMEGNAAWRQAI